MTTPQSLSKQQGEPSDQAMQRLFSCKAEYSTEPRGERFDHLIVVHRSGECLEVIARMRDFDAYDKKAKLTFTRLAECWTALSSISDPASFMADVRTLVDACYSEFCGDNTDDLRDDESVYADDREGSITFGMIRKLRTALKGGSQ